MLSNANARALNILDRLQRASGLTEEGRSAFIQLANPFSDFEFRKSGFPDSVESSSVVQTVKRSATISAPAGLASGTWDVNIFNLPILNANTVGNWPSSGVATGHNLHLSVSGGNACGNIGTINVIRGATGSTLNCVSFTGNSADFSHHGLSLDSSFSTGNSRLIGVGFEVHNTTADIYKQGAVCSWRMPINNMLDRTSRVSVLYTGPASAPTTVLGAGGNSHFTVSDVPGNLGEAMLLAGSRQWEAADGVMIVPTLISGDIPVLRTESCDLMITSVNTQTFALPMYTSGTNNITVREACGKQITFLRNTVTGYEAAYPYDTSPQKFTNFNVSGAFFSGLSLESSLVVNVIYYIERFPTPEDTNLVVLANPSPKYDPVFWPLYAACMREMPTGVKVGDNADGDWFFQLISNASSFLRPAFAALPGPWGVAGTAATHIAEDWAKKKLVERNRPAAGTKAAGSTWVKSPDPPKKAMVKSPQPPAKKKQPAKKVLAKR